jgi:translation elongation factor EF-4
VTTVAAAAAAGGCGGGWLCFVQTVANFYLAFDQDLSLLPVLNKVDLPSADPEAVTDQMVTTFDVTASDVMAVSAKTGFGLQELLPAVVECVV